MDRVRFYTEGPETLAKGTALLNDDLINVY